MNGVELFLLGRTLMKIGEQALPTESLGDQPGSARTVLVVVSDLREHGESTVGTIARRTGLPQSAVSVAVGRLREAGAIESQPDPRDRRRVLIRPARRPSARLAAVRSTPIDTTLAAALDPIDDTELASIIAALESLSTRLHPR